MSKKSDKGTLSSRTLKALDAYLKYFELDVYFKDYIATPLINNIETELFANLGPVEESVKEKVRSSLSVIMKDVIFKELQILKNPALTGPLQEQQIKEIEAKVTQSLEVISKDILNITDVFMNKEIGLIDEFAKTILDNAEKGMGYTVVAIPFLGDIVAVAKLIRTYLETAQKLKQQGDEVKNTYDNTKKEIEDATNVDKRIGDALDSTTSKVTANAVTSTTSKVTNHRGGSRYINPSTAYLHTLRNQVRQTGGRILKAKKDFFTRRKRLRR
jgi:hypothetical protein